MMPALAWAVTCRSAAPLQAITRASAFRADGSARRCNEITTSCWATTHIVMSPLEFMQRLAALVPRPRLHLIRFHGVLAPSLPHFGQTARAGGAGRDAGVSELAAAEPGCAHRRPTRMSWARLLKRVFSCDIT